MHDLLRRYARDHAAGLSDSEQAVGRLLDHYQHTATRADALIGLLARPGPPPAAPAGLLAAPDLQDTDQALAWMRADRASLLACLDDAAAHRPARQGDRAHRRPSRALAARRARAPTPSPATQPQSRPQQRAGDRLGQANALNDLGNVRRLTGDYAAAAQRARAGPGYLP